MSGTDAGHCPGGSTATTTAPGTTPWIRCFHPKPAARHTLVCFPHAGGSASYYFGLSAALDPDIEMVVIQYPGRENRLFEEPADSVAALADGVYEALSPRLSRRPAFFGHSMGGLIGFEVARRLESAGGPAPHVLVASASQAPSVRTERPAAGQGVPRSDAEADDAVLTRIMGLGGTRDGVRQDPELLRLVLPAIRADLRALEGYRLDEGAAVRCPVTVFVADGDPDAPLAEAGAWGAHTTADAAVHVFGGGHFYFSENPPEFTGLLQDTVRHSHPGTQRV
ncbi:thioesterase II family protein [Streptomyces sp. NBC_01012]|uniref:thioesterase II family protein n=1 Tax=Streptomyces sp. NBC_01012 TaxID=2903717 RepID=UPI00386D1265|nr:alpha/beta fold hydrolase [Streptomyces sp. NBC_01012]